MLIIENKNIKIYEDILQIQRWSVCLRALFMVHANSEMFENYNMCFKTITDMFKNCSEMLLDMFDIIDIYLDEILPYGNQDYRI